MATTLVGLQNAISEYGLEDSLQAYYSIYRAFVMDNADPEERGRIKISCPEVGHDATKALNVWVSPAVDITGDRMGWFNPPLVGSLVRVAFDNGNANKPKLYLGGWSTEAGTRSPVPTELGYVDGKPQKRGFRSRAGHLLSFNDAPGEEAVRLLWHQIADGDPAKTDPDKVAADLAAGDKFSALSFDVDAIQLIDADGTKIVINTKDKQVMIQDSHGNLITMSADGISLIDKNSPASSVTLDGSGDVSIIAAKNINLNAPNINCKGGGVFLGDAASFTVAISELLDPWLKSHTHNVPAGGPGSARPTLPPLAPPPPFNSSVKIKK